jgi:hypothetical protein
MLLGPMFARGASGTVQTGKFKGKMILVESLWDREAFPWQADWYRSKVKENLGESIDDHFVVWFTDHALHGDLTKQEDPTHTVSYLGVLQQALRDLSNWVEKGITPPASTNYKVVDGQILVSASALERKGIQPIINLKADSGERTEIAVEKAVTFDALIELPPHTGKIVSAEWDFEGAGTFPVTADLKTAKVKGSSITLKTTYKFTNPGTYFPTLRAVSQREGDAKTPFARIQNLARVRVVVR